jgi:D-aspartate ligase
MRHASGSLPPVALFDNHWAPTLAFAYSLGRRGVPLHVYGRGGARWSRYCTLRRPAPPVEDADQFLPWLRERVRSGEIVRVAPTTDLIAYYLSSLRELFPPEVKRTIAPLAEIETALIKSRFSSACTAIGQPVPIALAPSCVEEALVAGRALKYPLMLKPKSHLVVGSAERGCLIQDEAALRANFRRYDVAHGQSSLSERYPDLRWPLLQRYLPAARQRVYSVTGFKDPDSGLVTAGLSYKREQWPPDIGTSTVQISARDQQVLAAGVRTIDALASRGIFELELIKDGSELLAIDWNPRAFGFINLDIAMGRDLPWLWLCGTLGKVTPLSEPTPDVAVEARHALLHFLRQLSDRWTGRSRQPPHERRDPDRPRRWISILGHRSDPVPMMLAHAKLLQHPRSLLRTHISATRAERARRAALLRAAQE